MADPTLVDLADAQLLALVRELQEAHPLPLTLQAVSAYQLASVVQLALRHPALPPHVRRTAEQFVAVVCGHFAAAPTVRQTLLHGNDPAHDVPARPS